MKEFKGLVLPSYVSKNKYRAISTGEKMRSLSEITPVNHFGKNKLCELIDLF